MRAWQILYWACFFSGNFWHIYCIFNVRWWHYHNFVWASANSVKDFEEENMCRRYMGACANSQITCQFSNYYIYIHSDDIDFCYLLMHFNYYYCQQFSNAHIFFHMFMQYLKYGEYLLNSDSIERKKQHYDPKALCLYVCARMSIQVRVFQTTNYN